MSGKKRVYFQLEVPGARKVEVRGDFNAWDGREMKKTKQGVWKTWMALPPGRYEYRFVVDGEWLNDPEAARVPNAFGTENSVQSVR